MKESAGTLLYRIVEGVVEVLLVHASGNYNKKSKWSIPKGVPDSGESMEQAARRETIEETGVIAEKLESLGFVEYTKSRKRVHCFWGPAPDGAEPRCASWEVDRAEFVNLGKAKDIIHQDQYEFIARLESVIGKQSN